MKLLSKFKQKYASRVKKSKGATLLDGLLWLVVAGIVLGGLYMTFNSIMNTLDANSMIKQITTLKTATKSAFQSKSRYAAANDVSLNAVLIASGKLPSDLRVDGTTLTTTAGYGVAITSAGTPAGRGFKITFSGLTAGNSSDQALCLNVINELGNQGWESIKVGAGAAGVDVTTMDATALTAECKKASATALTFESR